MRRLIVLAAVLACGLAHAADPPRIVWLEVGGAPRVLSQDEALAAIASGRRIVQYATPDASSPVVVGLARAAPVPPADPLAALRGSLTAAYAEETDPARAERVKSLGELYAAAAGAIPTTTRSPSACLAATRETANKLITEGGIPKVRDATGAYLVGPPLLYPRDPAAAWTPETRATAAQAFQRLAQVLGGLK